MLIRVFSDSTTHFEWIDVVDPSQAELETLGEKYKLSTNTVQDALDPEHLPKYEVLESGLHFFIARSFDEESTFEADTVQELTRKVAVFYSDQFVLTIHRKDQPYLVRLRNKWTHRPHSPNPKAKYHGRIVLDLLRELVSTYEHPVDMSQASLEIQETQIFMGQGSRSVVEDLYYAKRKAFIYRRMLRLALDLIPKLSASLGVPKALEQDLLETGDRLSFHADHLLENVNQLLNVHISLSSNRSNEVMRVLTIFSVFFMPLTFIVGVYGMNFENMPELTHPWGYKSVWAVMVAVCVSIFLWFRHKGWLSRD
jgi:magnesium transporter